MAGGQERILRRRIKSVQATKKITRAMELIAGSRIVRAQQRVHAAMPYSDQITHVVRDLAAAGGEVSSPLLLGHESVRRVGFVALAADRGLCGGYNTGIIRATEGEVREQAKAGVDYSLILVGVSLLLWPAAGMGLIYVAAALGLGLLFVIYALRLRRDAANGRAAIGLFRYSISYLTLLFLAVALDALVPLPIG